MGKNERFRPGDKLSVVCTHPTTPASGDPVRLKTLGGVAQTNERADGTTSVDFAAGAVYELMVDDDTGAGITPGDVLYYQDGATGTPATNINNNATTPEAVFGVAMGTLGANATGLMNVRLRGTT
jgi:uncharacterized protein DUF2190